MADFCKQCSIELFGKDFGDLKPNLDNIDTTGVELTKLAWPALCEECGHTWVDHEGRCVYLCLHCHATIEEAVETFFKGPYKDQPDE